MLVHRLVSAAGSVNNTLVSSSVTRVHAIYATNANVSARYLKLYNKATTPAAGTDTPYMTLYLPTTNVNGGFCKFEFPSPVVLSTGLGYALTTAVADNDTGALTAADVVALSIVYTP